MRTILLSLCFLAASSLGRADEPRTLTAEALQKLWDETPRLQLREALPPGTYRISGTITKLEPSYKDNKRLHSIYLRAGKKEVQLEVDGEPPLAGSKLKVGAAVIGACEFHGHSEGGYVTLEACKL